MSNESEKDRNQNILLGFVSTSFEAFEREGLSVPETRLACAHPPGLNVGESERVSVKCFVLDLFRLPSKRLRERV